MAQLAMTYRVREPYLFAKDGSYALPLARRYGLHTMRAHGRAGNLFALSTRLEHLRSSLPPLFYPRWPGGVGLQVGPLSPARLRRPCPHAQPLGGSATDVALVADR